jgi:hypothetical protein
MAYYRGLKCAVIWDITGFKCAVVWDVTGDGLGASQYVLLLLIFIIKTSKEEKTRPTAD